MVSFLEELRALSEPAKKKILVAATVAIMIIVVYFWLAYFNNIIAGVSRPAVALTDQAAQNAQPAATGSVPAGNASASGETSLLGHIGNGAAFLYGNFLNFEHGLGNILQAPGQYNVQPSQ